MLPDEKCPYRLESQTGEVLCFDPWLAELIRPPVQVVDEWCTCRAFPACPGYLNNQLNTLPGVRQNFMLN